MLLKQPAALPMYASGVGDLAHSRSQERDDCRTIAGATGKSRSVTRQAGYGGLKAFENAGLIKAGRRSGRKTG